MCDQDHLAEMDRRPRGVSRRELGALGAMAALAACGVSEEVQAQGGLTERDVSFDAPGGTLDGFFVHPATGKAPAVILWPDIAGLRDAKKVMARRLAGSGYAVFVPNPFYRSEPAPQFQDFEDFRDNGGFQKVGPWMAQNTHENVVETARAIVAWLDRQDAVDTAKGIGTQGYCMGGPFTVRTAFAAPERVKAAASFHGGGLVTNQQNPDDPNVPIKLLPQTQASYLFAIAQNDDARAPAEKDQLKAAAEAAGRPAEIEVYKGDHGWTVPDSPVYNQAEADRAWERLLALYERAL